MSSLNDDGSLPAPVPVNPQVEENRRLSLRRREQLYYARHLQRQRQRLQDMGRALTTQREQSERQNQDWLRDRAAWDAERARAAQQIADQTQQLAQQCKEMEAARDKLQQQQERLEQERAGLLQQQARLQQEMQAAQVDAERRGAASVRSQLEAEFQAAQAKKDEEYDQALFEMQRRQRQAIIEMESALAHKQEELDKALAELKQRPTAGPASATEERSGILEAEKLQKLLAARNRELAKAAEEQQRDAEAFEKQRQELQAQVDGLRAQIAEKEAQVLALRVELQHPQESEEAKTLPPAMGRQLSEKDDEIDRLKAEVGALRRLLAKARDSKAEAPPIPPEEDALIDAPRAQVPRIMTPPPAPRQAPEAPVPALDLVAYESELSAFRRQLEADRRDLEEQLQELRERKSNLAVAGGQAEVEIARERASLSRERAQLERLRIDVRVDMERLQRECGTREALMGVQKLAEEMSERRAPREPTPRREDPSKGVGGLLRSLRSKFRDG
jgi:hypothetical protein